MMLILLIGYAVYNQCLSSASRHIDSNRDGLKYDADIINWIRSLQSMC